MRRGRREVEEEAVGGWRRPRRRRDVLALLYDAPSRLPQPSASQYCIVCLKVNNFGTAGGSLT